MRRPRSCRRKQDLERAARVLNEGKKVAILVGAGALHATDEVIEAADKLGAGVAKALLGKAALPDDLPFVTGSIGLLGTRPSYEMMIDCDTLFMIGSRFPYTEFLPEGRPGARRADRHRPAHGQHALPDGGEPDRRQRRDLAQAAAAARAQAGPVLARDHREEHQGAGGRCWKTARWTSANPLNPQRVFWELSPRLPENCIIACDTGSGTNWYARDLKIRRGMMASVSGSLATMGPGMPYAIAAKFAYPERPVVALVGDGALQMNGMNELITVAKYWKQWRDPRFIVLALNNRGPEPGDLGDAGAERRPEIRRVAELPDFRYSQYAEQLGLKGIFVDRPGPRRRGLGGRAWPPTGRSCSRPRPIRKCRRCRRISH